ncbi:5720_t:CDS:10 [Funneliformis caledonium]|uniref:5720_t:CDS:1 n=1 Tax=Funneliformis caledonium TaxID=1117310 RepID=A0A9N9DH32_9GLOM|nr:5720_t:CDS:10 [Funneliformis caledonium]
MSSVEEQPAKKIRLNSGGSIPSNDVINNKVSSEGKMTREGDVGITEFVDPTIPGFSGDIKQRFSDFLVYEIDNAGNIVHLTDFNLPEIKSTNIINSRAIETQKEEPVKKELSDEQIFQEMRTLLDEETSLQVQNLLNGKNNFVDTTVEKDKEKRTAIHRFFKNYFGDKLNTETKDGTIRISMHTNETRKDKRNKQQKNDAWDALGGSFCQFTLYKENMDTMDAVNSLKKLLKFHSKTFSYAGTKDRRAISVQKITANRIKAERLLGINRKSRGMKLGNFEYVKDPLRLGELGGNHFVITLKNIQAGNEGIITKAMDSMQSRGFINYFGMQRFGRLRGLLNTLLEFYTPMMNEEDNDELKIQNLPNRSTFERLKLLENDLYNLTAEKVFTKDYLQTILTSQNDKCSCLSETTNTVNDNCCSRNISCESKEIYNLGNNIKSNENFTERLLIDYREKVDKLLEELGFDKNSV